MAETPAVLLPKLKYDVGSFVAPGDTIGRSTVPSIGSNPKRVRLLPGPGTYVRGNAIFASTVGMLQAAPTTTSSSDDTEPLPLVTVSVIPDGGLFSFADQVIRKDQIVLAKVIRLTIQQVVVDIVANENAVLQKHQCAEGCIRREDIKTAAQQSESAASTSTTTTSTAILTQSFQPGDYLVARVVSLGDPRKYFLSTAEPALGVIFARSSVSGRPMMPLSWKEMECPDTGIREARKCAKPQNLPRDLMDTLQLQQTVSN